MSGIAIAQSKKNKVLKVVLLGDGGVGKSSLMNVYVNERFDPMPAHTLGVEFLKKEIKSPYCQEPTILQIWDTAGQERFKSLRTPFYRGSDACLLTFSVDDENSFRRLSYWKKEFLNYANVSDSSSFPFVVIGNKIDVSEQERRITQQQAEKWCKEYNMPYFETSAKDVINVDLAFTTAANKAIQLDMKFSPNSCTNMDNIKLNGHSSNGACC